MRPQRFSVHHLVILAVVILLSTGLETIAGAQSQEMKMAGWRANRRLFGAQMVTLPTGHLVPFEAPQDCAQAVLALLR